MKDSLINQRFGRGIVKSYEKPYYTLECDCGKIYKSKRYELVSCHKKSCGCLREERYNVIKIGDVFGKGTVIRQLKSNHGRVWELKCVCGNSYEAPTRHLKSGSIKSCGCNKHKNEHGEIKCRKWNEIIRGAKDRNLQFNITREYAWDLFLKQDRKCAISGVELEFGSTNKEEKKYGSTASLDRIDSSKGYIEGNVQWLHKDINRMKWDLEQDYFLFLCDLVYTNRHKDKDN